MTKVYAIDGVIPVVAPSAFVHPTAVLIGDVIVGADCYVGPGASLRGDFGRIEMKQGSNFQDNCTAHCFSGGGVVIGERGNVGHGAVLHGCTIGDNCLIGIKAVVLNGARIGANCLIGAHALITGSTCRPSRRRLSPLEPHPSKSGTSPPNSILDRTSLTVPPYVGRATPRSPSTPGPLEAKTTGGVQRAG